MSERSFSRRRRGGHRFRPSGGLSPKTKNSERAASDARAEAVGRKPSEEHVFDHSRHEREIQRAENVAAGLPADTEPGTVHELADGILVESPQLRGPGVVADLGRRLLDLALDVVQPSGLGRRCSRSGNPGREASFDRLEGVLLPDRGQLRPLPGRRDEQEAVRCGGGGAGGVPRWPLW